jgi:acyl-CoA synthetase (AMP-forming)/AMP-acid ligase II
LKYRLNSIIAAAGARFAIGAAGTQQRLHADGTNGAASPPLQWIDPDTADDSITGSNDSNSPRQRVALLQYTSGSTGTPRGVIVTHANLMHNSALIAEACGHRPGQTIAGWLPLFHDMGLIGLVLQAAFCGLQCVFMAPERFLMRPWLWLQMIADYGACSSPAPNFAYDLCVDKVGPEQKANLDLSCWRNALNGSEPVRPTTLERFASAFCACGFRPNAFFPCYGLAEATLFATGRGAGRVLARRLADGTLLANTDSGGHVGCGLGFGDTEIAIVDPQTAVTVPAGQIGEIWLAGQSIADGYWKSPEATAAAFNARLAASGDIEGRNLKWLRTGDLGFVADGELFITGRLRELIIVAGRNHFPTDIERTVESADPAIGASGAVAFSVDLDGAERLIIAAEVRREYARSPIGKTPRDFDPEAVRRRIRAAVVADNEVAPYEVVLLRPGAVPRTSSGKVSRLSTREAYLDQTLGRLESSSYARAAT